MRASHHPALGVLSSPALLFAVRRGLWSGMVLVVDWVGQLEWGFSGGIVLGVVGFGGRSFGGVPVSQELGMGGRREFADVVSDLRAGVNWVREHGAGDADGLRRVTDNLSNLLDEIAVMGGVTNTVFGNPNGTIIQVHTVGGIELGRSGTD
ncbi:hypothetical protein JOF56_001765 [Kibdelosporangium banguiense]|uniref:Uncharacterized protein n=1 Tax=Kibdelosporangium banguiense TaxID=1365924 RepID=A0ABS4TBB4_9PSEU|nr:hypothetical protein [Kibdelosporangium banguiense]MBP2321380.1 hypothetical protein [Kibdelosporangium banguiense]